MENIVTSPLDERELDPTNFGLTTISQMLSFLDVEEPRVLHSFLLYIILPTQLLNFMAYNNRKNHFTTRQRLLG